jgi:putative SOS response-associated peptidase YedK
MIGQNPIEVLEYHVGRWPTVLANNEAQFDRHIFPLAVDCWLSSEPDPHDLLISFPAEPMKMWPISKRVNSPRNDDEGLLTEIDLALAS